MAFSVFVPKMQGCRMGTAQIGDKDRSFPANFFPNPRKFLSFSSPAYCLLHTAYCAWPPLLFRGLSLSKQGLSLSNQGQSLSKSGLSLSKWGHSLSPQALIALYSYAICSLFGGELLHSLEEALGIRHLAFRGSMQQAVVGRQGEDKV